MNLGEVFYLTAKDFGEPAAARLLQGLGNLAVEVVSVNDEQVDAAMRLKARYKISYADAFAAGLSVQRVAPLVTGDREFLSLVADGLIEVNWIGA